MLTVGFDVTSLAQNRFGGIATVCRHTLLQAAAVSEIRPTALFRRGSSANVDETGVDSHKISWRDYLRLSRYDLVHALCHRIPPVRFGRLVYTLHDAWSLHPNRYQSPDFQRKIGPRMAGELGRADAVVCDSNATRDRLRDLGLVDPSRCHVVYPGVAAPDRAPDGPPPKTLERLLSSDFVLFVGRIEARKNLEHVIQAVLPLTNVQLVIVGEFGYGGPLIAGRTFSQTPMDRLHLLARISDSELAWLYQRALAALQPSWEEGFGLPMLGALAHGCPLITSNCSASAEVAGDAAILVDPARPDQSTAALLSLLDDPAARQKWSESGRVRSRSFTWEAYFRDLLALYRGLP